jgi:RNA polymerase primary sigma factor
MRNFKLTENFTPRSGKSISNYYSDIERFNIITAREEIELAERIQSGDMTARDKLATANLRFVISVAKMYGGTSDPELFNDLISVGNIGLIEAAEKFDHSRGFKFISFAVWHIRKEMTKYLTDNNRIVRIPQNKIQELRVMQDMMNKMSTELGREPILEEVIAYAEETGDPRLKSLSFDPTNAMMVMNASRKHNSLNEPINNDENSENTIQDTLASELASTDTSSIEESKEKMTRLLIAGLTPIEKAVVLKRHGIGAGGFEESYATIGQELGLTHERVRQIYMKSLKRMNLRIKRLKLQRDDIFDN